MDINIPSKLISRFLCAFAATVAIQIAAVADEASPVIPNNEGVIKLIRLSDTSADHSAFSADRAERWEEAFTKFEEALEIDPSYELSRQNLAIAHNDYALELTLQKQYEHALKEFHHAVYLDRLNATMQKNLSGLVRTLRLDDTSLEDREALFLKALGKGDMHGVMVEFDSVVELIQLRMGLSSNPQSMLKMLGR